jgi:hypothetical protein
MYNNIYISIYFENLRLKLIINLFYDYIRVMHIYFLGDEDRKHLEPAFATTLAQLKQLYTNGFAVDDRTFGVGITVISDMKCLITALGLSKANAMWFCVWCYRTKKDIHDHETLCEWRTPVSFLVLICSEFTFSNIGAS